MTVIAESLNKKYENPYTCSLNTLCKYRIQISGIGVEHISAMLSHVGYLKLERFVLSVLNNLI